MFTILAATTNKNKLKEIRFILNHRKLFIKSLEDFEKFPDVEENGKTFEENAIIKAEAYFKYANIPTIADDSGLEVPALGDEPGIFSARYAGPSATDGQNNQLLLSKLSALSEQHRSARFVCTICYKDANICQIFRGETWGTIISGPRGENGFGYDPLFYVPELGKTYAQLDKEEKNQISHRSKAIKLLEQFWVEKILPSS